MTYKEALLFVGKCLTLGIHPERISEVRLEIRAGAVVWEQIIRVSSGQFVLPALYIHLKKASLLHELPSELVDYLEILTDCNRERNLQILNQIQDISKLLNSHGIAPIFLKGTAHLLFPLYEDIAERMVGDIDFLVKETQMSAAAQLLIESGYTPLGNFSPELMKIIKHFPRLTNFNYPSAVEVHRQVIEPPQDKKFKSYEIISDKQKVAGSLGVYMPSIKHMIIHNILNTQVNDKAYLNCDVSLRQMYDLLLLSCHQNPQTAIVGVSGFSNHSNAYLAIVSKVFDHPNGIKYDHNKKVEIYMILCNFFIRHPGLHRFYKSTLYIFRRLSRYVTMPVQSIYRKDVRTVLWAHLSDPKWYKDHVLSYRDYFKPNL